jgi:hypothetical protein
MKNTEVGLTAQDILASIGFEAQRIAAGVSQHAAGAPFPDPKLLQHVIDRMGKLNGMLMQFGALLSMGSNGAMTAKLDN